MARKLKLSFKKKRIRNEIDRATLKKEVLSHGRKVFPFLDISDLFQAFQMRILELLFGRKTRAVTTLFPHQFRVNLEGQKEEVRYSLVGMWKKHDEKFGV